MSLYSALAVYGNDPVPLLIGTQSVAKTVSMGQRGLLASYDSPCGSDKTDPSEIVAPVLMAPALFVLHEVLGLFCAPCWKTV